MPDLRVSVVIPVYGGERHLARRRRRSSSAHAVAQHSPAGHAFRVAEVMLVHDCGPDDSPRVMRELAAKHDFVRTVWLSRNFGQHAATLAGMASSGGDWVVTMDEDGQHDPAYIADMLDAAVARAGARRLRRPGQRRPAHGLLRNLTSRTAKRLVNGISGGADATIFHSYRLILGEVGRSVAAYAGSGVYLDVALGWVAGQVADPSRCSCATEGERAGPATRSARCCPTSGGWCSPAAPAGCGW